jgi:prepilin-type N-terminal cleavage/methylation domain-containing protein/prepilin-type processing-associated H-X9-DG protein
MPRNARGFSLIELLVTIAILSILAAILLPVLAKGKMQAEQSRCLTNLRQLQMIGYMYVTDNGKQPSYSNPRFPGGGSWMGSLNLGTNQSGITVCPAARLGTDIPTKGNGQGTAEQAWVRWTTDGKTMLFGSYGFNSWFYSPTRGPGWNPANAPFVFNSEADVQKPAETPVFSDANWVDALPAEWNPPYHDLYTGSPVTSRDDDMGRMTICRHSGLAPNQIPRNLLRVERMPGAINIGMADGHAQLVPLENLWGLSWHRYWKTPAQRPQKPQ